MARKKKTARPAMPNIGLEFEYKRKLDRLIKRMNDDITSNILKAYGKNEAEITGDEKPEKVITRLLNKLMKKWTGVFNDESEQIAKWFVNRVDSNTRSSLGRSLAKASGVAIKFKTTPEIEETLDFLFKGNVGLIKTIPEQYHEQVNKEVVKSVKAGRDKGALTKLLHERYGVSKKRAAFIAHDMNNKASETISLERNMSLGITEGVWQHRGGSKQPRKSHIEASGKTFKLNKGLLIDGEYILPGEDYGCNCSYSPILPGFK